MGIEVALDTRLQWQDETRSLLVLNNCIVLGVVSRPTRTSQWQAFLLHAENDPELIGEFMTSDDAKTAVEKALK